MGRFRPILISLLILASIQRAHAQDMSSALGAWRAQNGSSQGFTKTPADVSFILNWFRSLCGEIKNKDHIEEWACHWPEVVERINGIHKQLVERTTDGQDAGIHIAWRSSFIESLKNGQMKPGLKQYIEYLHWVGLLNATTYAVLETMERSSWKMNAARLQAFRIANGIETPQIEAVKAEAVALQARYQSLDAFSFLIRVREILSQSPSNSTLRRQIVILEEWIQGLQAELLRSPSVETEVRAEIILGFSSEGAYRHIINNFSSAIGWFSPGVLSTNPFPLSSFPSLNSSWVVSQEMPDFKQLGSPKTWTFENTLGGKNLDHVLKTFLQRPDVLQSFRHQTSCAFFEDLFALDRNVWSMDTWNPEIGLHLVNDCKEAAAKMYPFNMFWSLSYAQERVLRSSSRLEFPVLDQSRIELNNLKLFSILQGTLWLLELEKEFLNSGLQSQNGDSNQLRRHFLLRTLHRELYYSALQNGAQSPMDLIDQWKKLQRKYPTDLAPALQNIKNLFLER